MYTFKEFKEKIQSVVDRQVGKTNQNAYRDITKDIQNFIDENYGEVFCDYIASNGVVDVQTECGNMNVFRIKINWHPDKRTSSGSSWKIDSVDVITNIPEEWIEFDACDISQCAEYELAKESRKKFLQDIEALKKEIEEKTVAIRKFENTMRTNEYKKNLYYVDTRKDE